MTLSLATSRLTTIETIVILALCTHYKILSFVEAVAYFNKLRKYIFTVTDEQNITIE